MVKLNSKFGLAILAGVILLFAAPAFAVDGQILINQSTVMAAGGFPYVITQTGSYKLSGNLVVPAATSGILIEANQVTLDLNGFTISGQVICSGLASTLSCTGPAGSSETVGIEVYNNGTIRNGMVRGFGMGVYVSGSIVEEIQATSNSGSGINLGGGVLRRSVASLNGGFGIQAGDATVNENAIEFNHNQGMSVSASTYSANTLQGNGDLTPAGQILTALSVSGKNNNCAGAAC